MIRRPQKSTLFPYPTLFRSLEPVLRPSFVPQLPRRNALVEPQLEHGLSVGCLFGRLDPDCEDPVPGAPRVKRARSEEHTSELQSRQYLVCRLLLEKKKKKST